MKTYSSISQSVRMNTFCFAHLSVRQCLLIALSLISTCLFTGNSLYAQCSSISNTITVDANTGMAVVVDVNMDGIDDFEFFYSYAPSPFNPSMPLVQSVSMNGLNGHAILVDPAPNAVAVQFGEEICANETYNTSATLYNSIQNVGLPFGGSNGAWIGLTNGTNIGFMFIQITAISATSVTISYNSYGMGIGMNIPVCNGDGAIVGDCNSIAVPVEMSLFEGTWMNDGIALRWLTETEIQNTGFHLERSLDGKTFATIHWAEGYGNSLTQREYLFYDTKLPIADQYYYRLQQLDEDGGSAYSDIIVISSAHDRVNLGNVYPNPTREEAWVKIQSTKTETAQITIFDIRGALLHESHVELHSGENVMALPIPTAARDMLLVKIQLGNQLFSRRVILVNE